MTDPQLQGLALQALNLAKKDYERGHFSFLLASYSEGETIHRMKRVEATISEKLGSDWLNDARKKDAAFGILRAISMVAPVDALMIVTGCNMFVPTPALLERPIEEQGALMHHGHDRHHKAVKEGLLSVADGLVSVAQTPLRMCSYVQRIGRAGFLDAPEVHFFDQCNFAGRLKMFGKSEVEV